MSLVGMNNSGMPDYEDRNSVYEARYEETYEEVVDELLAQIADCPHNFLDQWFIESEECIDEYVDDGGDFLHSVMITARAWAMSLTSRKKLEGYGERLDLDDVYFPSFKVWVDHETEKRMEAM